MDRSRCPGDPLGPLLGALGGLAGILGVLYAIVGGPKRWTDNEVDRLNRQGELRARAFLAVRGDHPLDAYRAWLDGALGRLDDWMGRAWPPDVLSGPAWCFGIALLYAALSIFLSWTLGADPFLLPPEEATQAVPR